MRLEILGPLRVWSEDTELDAGPPQQAYLLALLLARAGRPISVDSLTDLIWDGDVVPASAVNVIHKYVGALRRLLEPGLPARGASAYLQRRGDSYLFVARSGGVDLVDFRRLVAQARAALAEPRGEPVALAYYLEALELWRGPCGDGMRHRAAAAAIFAGLDEEFLDACTAAAAIAVRLHDTDRVLAPLRLAATMAPLNEPVLAGLISVLGCAGKQAEALALFRTVRERLVEELGVDPGAALVAAHAQVLNPPTTVAADKTVGEVIASDRSCLVGRAGELALLRRGVADAAMGGSALFVIEGEPGVGKTRLLNEIALESEGRAGAVAWGRCQQGFGAPPMWPWTQIMRTALQCLSREEREGCVGIELQALVELSADVLDRPVGADSMAQFRLFEQVADVLRRTAARHPLVVLIDDLQWADVTSLSLIGYLATQLPAGMVLVSAIRDRVPVPGPEQARALAQVSRQPAHRRIRLGPLDADGVADIVREEIGHDPGPGIARLIHARSGGNPFFARELARLLADGDLLTDEAIATAGVPATVRDVVADRTAALAKETQSLLRTAALIGRTVDLGLLARAAGLSAQACLDSLEPLDGLGLLEATPGDPGSLRFPHDLVRESIADGVGAPLAARLHIRIADAMDHDHPAGESMAEGLAFHLWAAGPLADPTRTTRALIRSGRSAAAKSAFPAAEQRLRAAADVARPAGLAEPELMALSELTAVLGTKQGFVGPVFALMERAEQLAESLGRDRDASDFLHGLLIGQSQGLEVERAGQLAQRLLKMAETSTDSVVRGHALQAWGWHRWERGAIGDALRYFEESEHAQPEIERCGGNALRRDLQLLRPGIHALAAEMHGEHNEARRRFDLMEVSGRDDAQVITLWAIFSLMAAGMAGDPDWVLRVVERQAHNPEHPYEYLDLYVHLSTCWARALTGDDPRGAAAEAETILTTGLMDPPMSGLAFNCALVAEMFLAAGHPCDAARLLDLADKSVEVYGQRYAEGLLLLLRAQLLHAQGEPIAKVRASAERARVLSGTQDARLFERRAERLLADLA